MLTLTLQITGGLCYFSNKVFLPLPSIQIETITNKDGKLQHGSYIYWVLLLGDDFHSRTLLDSCGCRIQRSSCNADGSNQCHTEGTELFHIPITGFHC